MGMLSTKRVLLGLLLAAQFSAQAALAQSGAASAGGSIAELPSLSGGEDELTASIPASSSDTALPSLPGLFALALENDASLASQRYEMQATAQQVPKAWAGLKPHIDASAGYTYQESDNYYTGNPDFDPTSQLSNPDNATRYQGETRDTSWQIQLTQPLFSLERWRQVDKAEAQLDAAKLKVAVAERDLALQVAEAYLNAFLASRKLGLLASKRESLSLQVKQAQRSYELGIGSRINLLEAQARLDQAVADQISAENELANALSALQRLTGRLPEFASAALGDLDDLEVEAGWENIERWLARTPANVEVLLAEQQLQLAMEDTSVRRAARYPELDLNLAYVDRGSNDPFRESENASASLQLSVPIYQGGYTTADIRQGELSVLASEAAYANALNLARQEVRKRLRSLNGDARQLEALKRSIDSAQLFLQAAEKGEQLGLRDLVDVLDARADLYDLRIQFVEVVRQYLIDSLSLEAAVGDLGTADLAEVMTLLSQLTGHTPLVTAQQ